MSLTASFMSANFVARECGFRMADWSEGDRAANAWFAPLATYRERFDDLLSTIDGFGLRSIDLWTGHLNPVWATDRHVSIARDCLDAHGLKVVSLAGWYGATPEQFEASCRVASAIGAPLLGGMTSAWEVDRDGVIDALDRHDLRLGFENHPERRPSEMLERIGDAPPARVGTTVDTGWYGTHGFDAADAIEALAGRVFHVHLKDVLEEGRHRTCRWGDGVVPIERCVRVLQAMGYGGAVSVEHEPEDRDPSADIRANLALLERWLDSPLPTAR
jgi:sugar phosphate isomerase/epimerase